jgi:hypothetical protein
MPRAIAPSLLPRVLIAVVLALLAPLTVLAERSLAQEPTEDTPPTITSVTIAPASLPSTGGEVTITVDAVDDFGIVSASAQVTSFFGSQGVTLLQTGPTTYSGTVQIGPNYSEEPLSHLVEVQLTDTNGALTFEIVGDVNVDAQPQFDEPPIVSDPSVEPRELPAAGGPVTFRVSAWDLRGITYAYARVTDPNGGLTDVELIPISSSQFEGTFDAPGNTTSTAQTYSVTMTAQDDIGQESFVDGGQFTVTAPAATHPGRGSVCSARHSGSRSPCARRK